MPIGRSQRGAALLLLIFSGAALVGAQSAPEPPPGTIAADMAARQETRRVGTGLIDVTAVTTNLVAFDKDGRAVLDLRPEELLVLEDGEPARLLALEPGRAAEAESPGANSRAEADIEWAEVSALDVADWRVVIYVSTELAGRFVLPKLCRQTAAEASRLTGLGPVELVIADPTPTLVTQAGHRPEDVRRALEAMADDVSGMTTVERIRNGFTQDFKPGVGFDQRISLTQGSPRSYATQARSAIHRERAVIRGELDRMMAWMQSQPPTARGLLVWMTGGFDLNPADFYIPLVEQIDPSFAVPLRTDYATLSFENDIRQIVEVALAHGWTVLPLNSSRADFVYGAEVDGAARAQHFAGVSASSIGTQTGDFSQVAPNYPLQIIAGSTGGELVLDERRLGSALDLIRGAYLVTYQVDRPADGRLHRLEIRCTRPGVRLRGRHYAASGSLRGVATARARRLLAGEEIDGALAMEAGIFNVGTGRKGFHTGDLDVTANLGELRAVLMPLDLGRMRITVVVEMENGSTFVHHQEMDVDWDRIQTGWSFSAGFNWPKKAQRAAVVVEELVSSSWGATTVALH
jgi:hypothetical protein